MRFIKNCYIKSKTSEKMKKKNAFEEWFNEYFMCTQGEDSPYSYDDIVSAFTAGVDEGLRKKSDVKKRESGGN